MKVEELESFLLEQKFIQDRVASNTTKRVFELHSDSADHRTVITVAQPDVCQIKIGGRQVFDGSLNSISYSDFQKLIDAAPEEKESDDSSSGDAKVSFKELPPELAAKILESLGLAVNRSLEDCLKEVDGMLTSKGYQRLKDGSYTFADGLITVTQITPPEGLPKELRAWHIIFYSGVEHISMICPISAVDTLREMATKLAKIAIDVPLLFPKNDPITGKFRKWHSEEIINSIKRDSL